MKARLSETQTGRLAIGRRLATCPSVPSMGRILLDERSQPKPDDGNRSKPQGVAAR